MHDYSESKPSLVCIGHNHYVYGNEAEIEQYKAIREKGEPLKSITIAGEGDEPAVEAVEDKAEEMPAGEFILDAPARDTGSKWYSIGSFFLPVFGIIGGLIFKKFKFFRNYKACKKGAIAGFATAGSIIGLFLLFLLRSLL